jgi:peptidyl-prolyl cis-trans isomerase A (cyclophilin A)/peptidyl-prolyl cis-trans isomerase B (cyclophilin B)
MHEETPMMTSRRFVFTLAATLVGLLALPLGGSAVAAPSSGPAPALPHPQVRVITNLGSFVMELYPDRAPLTVVEFLRYVNEGQYTQTLFHRVIPGFLIQGGGFSAADETVKPTHGSLPNESGNGLQNKRGWVGLARTEAPHSGNCQFYINMADNPELDPLPVRWGYTVFGKVIDGQDVLDRISTVPTGAEGKFKSDAPLTRVVIQKVELVGPAGIKQEVNGQLVPAPNGTEVLAPN